MKKTIAGEKEQERFRENTFFINIQNKTGIGGVERIVADFSEELSSSQISNLVFNLGRSEVTRKLLSDSIGRRILIFGREERRGSGWIRWKEADMLESLGVGAIASNAISSGDGFVDGGRDIE